MATKKKSGPRATAGPTPDPPKETPTPGPTGPGGVPPIETPGPVPGENPPRTPRPGSGGDGPIAVPLEPPPPTVGKHQR